MPTKYEEKHILVCEGVEGLEHAPSRCFALGLTSSPSDLHSVGIESVDVQVCPGGSKTRWETLPAKHAVSTLLRIDVLCTRGETRYEASSVSSVHRPSKVSRSLMDTGQTRPDTPQSLLELATY